MVCEPSVSAAALANTMTAPRSSALASASGTGVSVHWRSAYVGLPGPAKIQPASSSRASARSRASPGGGAVLPDGGVGDGGGGRVDPAAPQSRLRVAGGQRRDQEYGHGERRVVALWRVVPHAADYLHMAIYR